MGSHFVKPRTKLKFVHYKDFSFEQLLMFGKKMKMLNSMCDFLKSKLVSKVDLANNNYNAFQPETRHGSNENYNSAS